MKKLFCLCVASILSAASILAQTPITSFKAAALNVDGLPASIKVGGVYNVNLNPDSKGADGATAIGKKLNTMGYDVIGVSEDFNYHNQIVGEMTPYYVASTYRGEIPTSPGISFIASYLAKKSPLFSTDGLCLFYKNLHQATNEQMTAWNQHNGYSEDGADGLIDKGFRYYTITIDGVDVDLYILHMDAEITEGDIAARESQIVQLAATILASSNKRPIIVMGDTNCRYTRDRLEQLFIGTLNADERFTAHDAWVDQNYKGIFPVYGSPAMMVDQMGYAKGEIVDKIFFINNKEADVVLKLKTFKVDTSFVNEKGEPLADHFPVVADFEVYQSKDYQDELPTYETSVYYLRNVSTGKFLKAGGQWGTHAVVGDYGQPLTFTDLGNGKYEISTPMGYISTDAYMDGSMSNGVHNWTLRKTGNYHLLVNGNQALSANHSTYFTYRSPNYRYVTFETANASSRLQQWELLTQEDLLAEALTATPEKPCNMTYLLPGANFDRNDPGVKEWNNSISASASVMTYNLSDGKVDFEMGNPVAEVYVNSFSGYKSYETRWEISQTLTGLPNGRYRISMQGYYRVKDHDQDPTGTADIFLYVRSGEQENKTLLCQMYDTKVTKALSNAKTSEGYYVPNSMQDATMFFNAGYYLNEVEAEVTDGTLTIAVGKESESKSSSVWTCFDNFQILYLNTEEYANAVLPIEKVTESTAIYDLSGRRTTQMRKGIYIVNGKKVVK